MHAGTYPYMSDLLRLDQCRPQSGTRTVQERLAGVFTPLCLEHWQSLLARHPDKEYVQYILKGIQEGFRIGFENSLSLSSARKNMHSAMDNPKVVSDYIEAELLRGVLLGPFAHSEVPEVHLSRFGVIPKSSQPGKWRLIVDLSHPEGKSVNDGISPELCSLKYVRVDDVVRKLLDLGPGAKMAKMDIKAAYRMVPVHPQDRHLLGMKWENRVYVDAALPFGLRSAPKIFNALADALEWIAREQGVQDLWHYLDDFITCGSADSEDCCRNLELLVAVCCHLGIPLAKEKLEGPTTCLVFLGIVIDTVRGELSLPLEKLTRLRQSVQEWLRKKKCTKRELLSIAGQLQHAATVVRPGRTFLRRLFDLSATVAKPDYHIRLNAGVRSDLAWWHEFLEQWNGVSLLTSLGEDIPSVVLTSDASGSWGCGAFWNTRWFQFAWADSGYSPDVNIATKELVPIVMAAAIWGKYWVGLVVSCRCDNEAVVAVLNSRTSRDYSLMHLLRCLTFFEAKFSFRTVASHIAGVENSLADALSRNNLPFFFQAAGPGISSEGCLPPQPLVDMLINQRPDWTSQTWRKMFNDILNMV